MKRVLALIMCLILFALPLSACSSGEDDVLILKISNCEDYIDEDMCDDFEAYMAKKGVNVKVEYSTFGTLENLYNDIKIAGGYVYDLICPSDYMIEKMAREGMLATFDEIETKPTVYSDNASPYIKEVFSEKVSWDGGCLADYACAYMWGTLGILYNPAANSDITEDMRSWYSLWNKKYANKLTIKDSIRDSYFIGVAYACKDELLSLDKNSPDYQDRLAEIFNRTDAETVKKAEEGLLSLKKNIYGFEVDSGKNDMITGKIDINFAWSGDAVYSMYEAADSETPTELLYSVPEEGSNIWFDGWCIPKCAKNKDLAVEFINFLSMPENAIKNMEYIFYTSAICGEEIEEWMVGFYGLTTEPTEENTVKVDIGYFFGEDKVFYTDTENGQFATQYPSKEITDRCTVMHYFDNEANTRINKMWENVKGESLPVWAIVLIAVIVVLLLGFKIAMKYKDAIYKRFNFGSKKRAKIVDREML